MHVVDGQMSFREMMMMMMTIETPTNSPPAVSGMPGRLPEGMQGGAAPDDDKSIPMASEASANIDGCLCLITKEELDHTRITLHCKHSFNYVALFTHLATCVKTKGHKSNTIECPYCRGVTPHVLPMYHDPEKRVYVKSGVNSPKGRVMPEYKCKWVLGSGKNKGSECGSQGCITNHGVCCMRHYKCYDRQEKKTKSKKQQGV